MMRGRRIVVTGTDTEIGKTFIACALSRALADSGIDVVAVKPVESGRPGAEPGEDEDGVKLARATRQHEPRAALTRLEHPLAPPVAADLEGVELDWSRWIQAIEQLSSRHELTVVEGAGGLLSPLTWDKSALDLGLELVQGRVDGSAVLVVAPDRLGTLNHTMLTLEALQVREVPVAGVVFSAPDVPDDSTGRNAPALRRFLDRQNRPVRVASVDRFAHWSDATGALAPVVEWVTAP